MSENELQMLNPAMSRRTFVKGLSLGAMAAGLHPSLAHAADTAYPVSLRGSTFKLDIGPRRVNFTGRSAMAMTINGSIPGPTLHWREGDVVTLNVTNHLAVPTSVHWHGVIVPNDMDGVPGVTYRGIEPGETFVYRFKVRQSGTFWYHSHTKFQEQSALYGPIVIAPREADPVQADRDYVVMLNDWTDEDPNTVFRHLKVGDDYYNYHKRTVADFFRDASQSGLAATLRNRWAWGMMRMSPRDITDVSGRMTGGTYTYLMNGRTPTANWTGLFKPGERVRLRFVNGSAMTYFDVRIPGLKMTVVAADGSNVQPVSVDEFRIAVAETYDVIVEPRADAYTIFAQSMDRSGYVQGTLAVREGLSAPIPPMDPVFSRTMVDMGMGNMQNMKGMKMSGMKMADTKGMDMSGMKGRKMAGMEGMHTPAMKGSGMRHAAMPMGRPNANGQTAYPQPQDVHLAIGPAVVNIVSDPTERLDLPGDGLNHNGRRVLTYADLVRLDRGPQNVPFDTRDPDADVLLHLTGNMDRYIFGFNGLTYDQSQPVRFPYGQRIRVTLVNDTMMEHPIHLHGLFTELDNHHGRLRPLKHTISVKPAEKVHYFVDATEPGRWAYHCHLLYHMEAGMFTTAVIA